MKLYSVLKNGCWPFTPDPAPCGPQIIGTPAQEAPWILAGNSRHALAQLQRLLSLPGGRVICLDTGGLELSAALRASKLDQQSVIAALQQAIPEQATSAQTALLPYPAWQRLGAAELVGPDGWRILPGPAGWADTPAYLAGGPAVWQEAHRLPQALQTARLPLEERMHLALSQAGLLLVVAVIPLLLAAPAVLLAGSALFLLFALLLAWAQPWLTSQPRPAVRLVALGLCWGLLSGLVALLAGSNWLAVLAACGAAWIAAGWQAYQFARRVQEI